MKHVVIILPGLQRIGGAEQQVIQLARGLSQRGWRVSLITLAGSPGEQTKTLLGAEINLVNLAMRKGLADPRGWLRLNRWLRHEHPDVVHAHLPHAVWLARWSRLAAPMRVLVDTVHTSATGRLGRRLGYRLSNWLPDKVTAVSQAVAEAYLNARMATEPDLVVIPNGVDTVHWQANPEVREKFRRKFNLANEFVWFTAGRLDPVKDYPSLLAAFHGVPDPSRLVIAGDGPLNAQLRSLAKHFGLESRVRFLGFTPDVLPWLLAADAFVLASQWEGLPVALLEAAACQVPIVATDVPGTCEVVADGITGILAESKNPRALELAMTRMMQLPPEDRYAMGRNARQSVISRYSRPSALDRWEQLYEQALLSNTTPARFRRKSNR